MNPLVVGNSLIKPLHAGKKNA